MTSEPLLATSSPYIEVKKSRIHNNGVFARMDIPKGVRIIQYVGEKITKREADRRADLVIEESKTSKTLGAVYLFELNKRYDIDGNVHWNTARFINHSCSPNCETINEDGKIWIESTRNIKKGEELGYNYGYDFESYEEHPCKCSSSACVGYILQEKQWKKLQKK
ncbi:TPA: SET domain-containing protein [Candidatus Woesearchaeota archaeon]|nr:SET domain-containing protein-lysine N-methyltransferase [archaeon]HIJ10718.1 SET domain-containing protein [Candidatus Woesearchaeota archaeon]